MANVKVNGESLSQITDEALLTNLLDSTHDYEARKLIRARLQEVKKAERVKRDNRLEQVTSHREDLIQQRQRQANEAKARTLQMYDNMAKSGNAGDHRPLDINTYSGKTSGKLLLSGTSLQKRDLVEETIQARAKACDNNKKRLLAAFDYAAKTQPAGTIRDIDFESFKGVDVSGFEQDKLAGTSTFEMSGGVPKFTKPSQSAPSTPVIDIHKAPSFKQEQPNLDAYERSLRQRKAEADERKRRTLAAYSAIARSGEAGPKLVVQEELQHLDISEDEEPPKPKFSCTTSFSGGYARI